MGVDYAEPIARGQCWIAFYARHGYRETHRDEQHGFRRVFFTKPVLC